MTEFRREFLARDQQKILRNLQLLVRLKQPVVLADCHPVQTAGPGGVDDFAERHLPVDRLGGVYVQIQPQLHASSSFPAFGSGRAIRPGVFLLFHHSRNAFPAQEQFRFFSSFFKKKSDRARIVSARVIHFKKEFAEKRGEIPCKIGTFVVE